MENEQTPVEQTQQPIGDPVEQKQEEQTVSYDSYRKLLSEKKKASSELQELREFKKNQELAKMQEEGQHKEVIEALRAELNQVKQEKEETTKKVAFDKFTGQVEAVAKEMGCADIETLMFYMNKEKMASIQIDEKLNANKDDLLRELTAIKDSKPFLFANNTVNHTPVNLGGFKKQEPKGVAEMSLDELKAHARKTL